MTDYEQTLATVSAHLIAQLDRLSEISADVGSASEMQLEIERSKAVDNTCRVVIDTMAALAATRRIAGDGATQAALPEAR